MAHSIVVENPTSSPVGTSAGKIPAAAGPLVSVIVPVHNDPGHLRCCLQALTASMGGRFEVLVVDDASTDETPAVAWEFDVRLIRQKQKSGPAAARNAGAAAAAGEYLLFVDADVCVEPTTIAQVVDALQADREIDAVFGSYDRQPGARNLLSQYRNLFHHFVHQHARRDASTFWAGCGAVKRAVFLQAGGFDERYRRPCVEDIELGMRLTAAGRRIVLDRSIQVRHLKQWNLWSIIQTDVADRALPWTELIFREKHLPDDLNLKKPQRAAALLSCGVTAALLIGAVYWPGLLWLAGMGLLLIGLLDRRSRRGPFPTIVQGAAAVAASAAAGLSGLMFGWWILIPLLLTAAVVVINGPFYAFLARERGWWFAAFCVPLHLLYYNYSAVSFAAGAGLSLVRSAMPRSAAWRLRPRRAEAVTQSLDGGLVASDT